MRVFALRRQVAVTSIELLVVIVVLGILMAFLVPSYLGRDARAKDSAAQQTLAGLAKGVALEATSSGGLFPAPASLRNTLSQDNSTLNLVSGRPTNADATGKVVMDTDSSTQGVVMHTLSATGKLFTLTASPGGGRGSGRYAAEVLKDDPLTYWRLSEPRGEAVDYGGLNNHGTYDGTVRRGFPGALLGDIDFAARFDGNNAVDAPAHASTAFTNRVPYSIEAWVYVDPSASANLYQFIANRYGTGDARWQMYLTRHSATSYQMSAGRRYSNGVSALANSNIGAVPLNQWSYWVATYDGSRTRLYLNGNLITTGASNTTNLTAMTSPLRLGNYAAGGPYGLGGALDDVAIYNKTLTAAQVSAHYAAARE